MKKKIPQCHISTPYSVIYLSPSVPSAIPTLQDFHIKLFAKSGQAHLAYRIPPTIRIEVDMVSRWCFNFSTFALIFYGFMKLAISSSIFLFGSTLFVTIITS